MSTILVEIFNQSFETVTIVKPSTGTTIATIGKGPTSKTFRLSGGSNIVAISAASPEAATVSLEGSQVPSGVAVQGVSTEKELYVDDALNLQLSTSTMLRLRSVEAARTAMQGASVDGVKCGEVVILPEPS